MQFKVLPNVTPLKYKTLLVRFASRVCRSLHTAHAAAKQQLMFWYHYSHLFIAHAASELGQKQNNYSENVLFWTNISSAAKVINSVAPDASVMSKSVYPSIRVPLTLTGTQFYPLPQPLVLKVALPDSMLT